MKRSRQTKNNIRKKTTIIILAISLVMLTSQNGTTYAFFKDTESIVNDLVIKMGSISVNVTQGFDNVLSKNENQINHTFKIENTGTLKQNLKLKLVGENKEVFNYINYSVGFEKHNSKSIKMISGKLNELINKEIKLKYEDGSMVILNKNEGISAHVKLTIDTNIPQELLSNLKEDKFKIDLNVTANQINANQREGKGFNFAYTQENYLKIKFRQPNNEINSKKENEKDYSNDKIENIEQVNKDEDSLINLEESNSSKDEENLNEDREKIDESLLNNLEIIEGIDQKQDLENNFN
ncbi:MAG: hypothetical protein ACRCVJ_05470 [Clostridium sp.]|uniref:hypothetical protein n=1 Tax=Clostridium sp. TaxID=1506 RepID=UPI003F32EC8C